MNPTRPDHVVMTEALDLVREVKADYAELLRESEERKATLVRIQNALGELKRKTDAELAARAAVILDLTQKLADRTTSVRRNANALMVTLTALDKLCKCFVTLPDGGVTIPGVPDLVVALREAREVIAVHGFPF